MLHNRSVELAKKYQVNLEVLSSFERKPGTKVKEVAKNMEKTQISGVATDKNVARLALVGGGRPAWHCLQSVLSAGTEKHQRGHHRPVHWPAGDPGHQLYRAPQRRGPSGGAAPRAQGELALRSHRRGSERGESFHCCAGMVDNAGVAAKMFGALYDADINIHMISTSEIKVSVLLDESDAKLAVQAIHDKFFGE